MSEVNVIPIASTSIATPVGKVAVFSDLDKKLKQKDDTGFITSLGDFNGFSIAAQSPAATTKTYITGSKVAIPSGKLQVGTMIRWSFNMTKTGAGIATSLFEVVVGTNGTTADTTRLSFTKPAGTAVIDEGWVEIVCVIRSIGAAGVMVGEFWMIHNLAATGHMVIPCACINVVSAGFDMTVANLFIGLCITTGAADAITIQQVITEVFNL